MAEISAGIISRKIPRKGRRILSPLELPTAWEKVACTCTYSRKGSGKKEKKNLLLLHFSLFFFQQPPSSCHPVPFPAISSSTSILLLVDSVVIASDSISRAIHLVGRRRGRGNSRGTWKTCRQENLSRESTYILKSPFPSSTRSTCTAPSQRGKEEVSKTRQVPRIDPGRKREKTTFFSQKVEREKKIEGVGSWKDSH